MSKIYTITPLITEGKKIISESVAQQFINPQTNLNEKTKTRKKRWSGLNARLGGASMGATSLGALGALTGGAASAGFGQGLTGAAIGGGVGVGAGLVGGWKLGRDMHSKAYHGKTKGKGGKLTGATARAIGATYGSAMPVAGNIVGYRWGRDIHRSTYGKKNKGSW